MIFIFYNQDNDVCVNEYEAHNGDLITNRKDVFCNNNLDDKLFKEKLGSPSHFIDKVILNNQSRFAGQDVYIFNGETDVNLYDQPDLVNALFVHRREIHVFNVSVTEEDVKEFARWIAQHSK